MKTKMSKTAVCLFSLFAVGLCANLGGWQHGDVNDKMLQDLLHPLEQKLNDRSNSIFYEKIVNIIDVQKQVVAGMKWKIVFVSGRTACAKNDKNIKDDLSGCEVQEEHGLQECSVTVFQQAWKNYVHIEKPAKCVDYNAKKSLCEEIGNDKKSFEAFKAKHNKLYESNEEDQKRFQIFQKNMMIARDIQKGEQGTACYGATQFADLDKEEFKKYLGLKPELAEGLTMKQATIPKAAPPAAYDWRDHGAVTPVKNQGSCGSCWAFSTTGNIEGQWAIKKKNLVSLSEQELVDCDKVDHGCEGGLPSQAYKEIERIGGLEGEKDYKYTGEDDKCTFAKSEVKVYINSSVSISKDEGEMASWLAQNGPISIGINAAVMQFYFGGVSHPWKIFCNPASLDHGVLIVGYGTQGGKPYWAIKNSWGPSWGEKGYYLAFRGDGVCGLNEMCTSSVVN